MKTHLTSILVRLMFAVVCIGICTPLVKAQGPIIHLSAEFQNFGGPGDETTTNLPVPGIIAYQKTGLFVPPGLNVLYITMSMTADTHGGNSAWFSCNVNGIFCNPGMGGGDFAPPGWLAFSKHFDYDTPPVTYNAGLFTGDSGGGTGDMHDNSIYYTWCTTQFVPTAPNTIQIRLASSNDGVAPSDVAFEGAHFYIDAQQLDGGCRHSTPPPPPDNDSSHS